MAEKERPTEKVGLDLVKGRILIGVFSVLAAISVLTAAGSITALAYQERILPKTLIAGEKFGGLPKSQAIQKLQGLTSSQDKQELTLEFKGQTASFGLENLGVKLDSSQVSQVIIRSVDPWDWLRPRYWQEFFQPKNLRLSYLIDEIQLEQEIRGAFQLSVLPIDAQITIKDSQLEVIPSTPGQSVGLGVIESTIDRIISGQNFGPVQLASAEAVPTVTTELATQTKTEIESRLKPVYLQSEQAKFTIPVTDQYGLINFSIELGKLVWQFDRGKLQAYLDSKIARKLNIRMVQKTIMADTQEVTNPGKDGQQVLVSQLTDSTYRTITEQTDTSVNPLSIPIQKITLSEKIVYPDYILGLFPGTYIDISLPSQTLYIINGSEKVASYRISSGRRSRPTPTGLFYIKNKIPLARSRLYPDLWMKRWNALARNPDGSGYEGYGVHDLPCFDPACNRVEGASHIGQPVSHGCVRVEAAGAGHVYDGIPVGTPVNIH